MEHKPILSKYSIENSRFLILVVVLIVVLVVEPIVFGSVIRSWVFDALYSVLVVATILVLFAEHRAGLKISALGLTLLFCTWLTHSVSGEARLSLLVIGHILGILFLLATVFETVRSVFAKQRLSADSFFGAIAGYLLLGITWGTVYSLIHLLSPNAFDFGENLPRFIEAEQASIPLFVYYSFVTLTTLGFGDMTPISQTARTLSWVEAVAGLFYIGVLVAGLVGVYVSNRVTSDLSERVESDQGRNSPLGTEGRPGRQA